MLDTVEDKYSIINGQWIWNTDNPKYHNKNGSVNWDKLLDLSDNELVKARREFLIDIDLNHPPKLTLEQFMSDMNTLSQDKNHTRFIMPYGAGSGKTTIFRQYAVQSGEFILYATKLVKDVNFMYFDLNVMKDVRPPGQKRFYNNPAGTIVKYTQDDTPTIEQCQNARVLLITHARLFIDPPSILFCINPNIGMTTGRSFLRGRIFIDEYVTPYKKYSYKLSNLVFRMIDQISGIDNSAVFSGLDRNARSNCRSAYLERIFNPDQQKYLNRDDKSIILALSELGWYSESALFDKRTKWRDIYFIELIAEYYNSPKYINNNYLEFYYDLPDYIRNVYILDGTGDINFRTSDLYRILKIDDQFKRYIKLNQLPKIVKDSSMKRLVKKPNELTTLLDNIDNILIRSIIDVIKELDSSDKLLVYTWKSFKLDDKLKNTIFKQDEIEYQLSGVVNDLPKYLTNRINELYPDYKDRFKIITYQSGLERTTSEFINYNSIYVFGDFVIPQEEINVFNVNTDSKLSQFEYTKPLIIQAFLRTSARRGKPINIYFNEDFDHHKVNSIMKEFNIIEIDRKNYKKYYDFIDLFDYNSRNYKYYQFICDNYWNIINKSEIALPINERSDKFKIGLINYLNNYEFLNYTDITDFDGISRSKINLSLK